MSTSDVLRSTTTRPPTDSPIFTATRIPVSVFLILPNPHDYIHASWVDGYRDPYKFIVCQAPMPHTMEHFWKMQWQEKTGLVISMIQMYDVEPPEHYYDWEDKGTPKRPAELLMFISDMNFNRLVLMEQAKREGWLKEGETSPISINCLAGTGRSCVIIALDIICRKMDDTVQATGGSLIDVEDTVMRLRS